LKATYWWDITKEWWSQEKWEVGLKTWL